MVGRIAVTATLAACVAAAGAAMPARACGATTSDLHGYAFHTPSRNIWCVGWHTASRDDVQCWVFSTATKTTNPGAWGLEDRGKAIDIGPTCDGPGDSPVLAYGRRWSQGWLACDSRATGLTCRSRRSGHGFFLSRESQHVF